jgi:hypothetical protein
LLSYPLTPQLTTKLPTLEQLTPSISAKSAALYHHEVVNNLCHALPCVPWRWSLPKHKPLPEHGLLLEPGSLPDQLPAADHFAAELTRRWHVAYALEFVIYQPPLVLTASNYLRSKALHLRKLQRQHQQFISQLPVQDHYWQQRPDGSYSGSFLVSKWHVATFIRCFDERFAKLGYKRFGAWAPYSFASPPADG